MKKMAVDTDTLTTIYSLAQRLKTSEENIVKKAVCDYEKRVNQNDSLMEIAGISKEDPDVR